MRQKWGFLLAGLAAGAVCGLFGAGGGMVLIPLMGLLTDLPSEQMFPASVAIMLPIVTVSLLHSGFLWDPGFLPFLLGGAAGGFFAGWQGYRLSPTLLHRALGVLILWAGVRYLW